jgi:hypothetical protein
MGLNLLALASSFFATNAQAQTFDSAKSNTEAINTASLKAIESTWLKVPPACKAAGFNAKPVALKNDIVSADAIAIYQSYGA